MISYLHHKAAVEKVLQPQHKKATSLKHSDLSMFTPVISLFFLKLKYYWSKRFSTNYYSTFALTPSSCFCSSSSSRALL